MKLVIAGKSGNSRARTIAAGGICTRTFCLPTKVLATVHHDSSSDGLVMRQSPSQRRLNPPPTTTPSPRLTDTGRDRTATPSRNGSFGTRRGSIVEPLVEASLYQRSSDADPGHRERQRQRTEANTDQFDCVSEMTFDGCQSAATIFFHEKHDWAEKITGWRLTPTI